MFNKTLWQKKKKKKVSSTNPLVYTLEMFGQAAEFPKASQMCTSIWPPLAVFLWPCCPHFQMTFQGHHNIHHIWLDDSSPEAQLILTQKAAIQVRNETQDNKIDIQMPIDFTGFLQDSYLNIFRLWRKKFKKFDGYLP